MGRSFARIIPGLIVFLATPSVAAPIDVTVATEGSTYSPGQALRFLVTARNTTGQDLTLHFGSSLQAQYALDERPFYPNTGLTVLTHQTIPANGSYTWTFRHRWAGDPLDYGDHSVIGRVLGVGPSVPVPFTVVPPTFPTDDFSLNFDTLPGTDIPITSIEETWSYGVRFRSKSSGQAAPGIYETSNKTNTYVGVMSTTYPPGFNIIADFDVPVHGATVNVSSAAGVAITMIARDRDGQLLASVTSDPVPAVGDFTESLSISSVGDIHSLEWWPSQENAAVFLDNLAIALPEPGFLTITPVAFTLLSRRRSRCDGR